ncbi:MAG: YicC family protein [Gammaproteobacteria bacterium]|nr:YicC family protein [Gammaproteobacteria bacterium]
MAHSMTAFARQEHSGPYGTLTWEIRSVNHRFLEPHLRLPESLRTLESTIRELLRKGLSRGKIECSLQLTEAHADTRGSLNLERAREVVTAAEQIAALISQPAPLDPIQIMLQPGVLSPPEANGEQLQTDALQLFNRTLAQLKDSRAREGAELARLISERLDSIEQETRTLADAIPGMLDAQRQKILDRCQEIALEIDPQRLEQELVMLAQRSDVAEELDRLHTHLNEVRRVLNSKQPVGRRLDFLMQELNREANTLGSKAIDVRTTQAAVNIKVLIEQMREQIQNIE